MDSPQVTWDEENDEQPQVQWDEAPKSAPAQNPPAETPGFLNTLGREVTSAGKSIIETPASIYHAFADDVRPDEKGTIAETISKNRASNPVENRIALGLHRTVTQPLAVAGQWWKNAITGQNPNAYEEALSVAPEAVGSAAGNVVLGKAAESVPRAAGRAVEVASDPALRSATGAAVKAGAAQLPKAAVKRIPYIGKVAGDVYDAATNAYRSTKEAIPLDATEENAPYAGGYDLSSPEQMQAWWKGRGGVLKSERPEGPIHGPGPKNPAPAPQLSSEAAIPTEASTQSAIPTKPRYAYRSRNVGEEGIPATSSHAHATMSEPEARSYLESRGAVEGKPQELVRVDLSQLPENQFSILAGPRGNDWVRFNQPLPESAVSRVEGSAIPTQYGVEDIAQGVERALGGKPLEPNVPLREQLRATRSAPKEPSMLEGHTKTESSAVKSYRYDPDKQELHIQANNGQVHVYGDVSAEDAANYANAESKGRAWAGIKQRHPHVAKFINGKRVAVRPTER